MTSQNITILDGGMGRELERMGAPFSQPLWSAQALIEDPRSVYRAHLSFAEAGADVLTTNAYALVPHHMGDDLYQQRHAELTEAAAQWAGAAADQYDWRGVRVAGCVPPVFGSYRPDLFCPDEAAALIEPFFRLQRPWCDLWLAETVSSLEELQAIHAAWLRHGDGLEFWVSLTLHELNEDLQNPVLRSGRPLGEALAFVASEIRPSVLMFNCCPVENILPAIRMARDTLPDSVKIGGYANAFTNSPKPRQATITSTLRNDVTPDFYLAHARTWAEAGATIIGGCCGVGPEHIRALRDHFSPLDEQG